MDAARASLFPSDECMIHLHTRVYYTHEAFNYIFHNGMLVCGIFMLRTTSFPIEHES